mgnify:CR=1 FL=1
MRYRTIYLPMAEAAAGMTLAAPLNVSRQGLQRFSLPQGHVLTEDNLSQMAANYAEFIFIAEPDGRSDEQVAIDMARVAHRVMEIFAGADFNDPILLALFDQILTYRNA